VKFGDSEGIMIIAFLIALVFGLALGRVYTLAAGSFRLDLQLAPR
jgi:hypothetical protein